MLPRSRSNRTFSFRTHRRRRRTRKAAWLLGSKDTSRRSRRRSRHPCRCKPLLVARFRRRNRPTARPCMFACHYGTHPCSAYREHRCNRTGSRSLRMTSFRREPPPGCPLPYRSRSRPPRRHPSLRRSYRGRNRSRIRSAREARSRGSPRRDKTWCKGRTKRVPRQAGRRVVCREQTDDTEG